MDHLEEEVPPEILEDYHACALYTLMKEFPRFPLNDLKRILVENKSRFPPSHRIISAEYQVALAEEQEKAPTRGGTKRARHRHSKLIKVARDASRHKPAKPCPYFDRVLLEYLNAGGNGLQRGAGSSKVSGLSKEDPILLEDGASTENPILLNDDFWQDDRKDSSSNEAGASGNIECGCCCSDFRFEEMVQCSEGHLFCFGCLRRRVEESTFGGSKAASSLPCMDTGGCEECFPWSEVKRALPAEVLLKYEQRQAEHAVVQAKLSGLVYCPFCNMPWEVDPDLRVLECANVACRKASCLLCKEPSHIPLRCEEVEKKSETSARRNIEELMTKALIRVCTACKAELVKSDGCNKVTCRCGQTICYVCRQPIQANYQHFCNHVRVPGKDCKDCTKCHLWHEEAEDEVVKAAREAALRDLAKDDPNLLKRTIGPKLEKQPKKRQKYPVLPAIPFRPPPPEYYNRLVQNMVAVGVGDDLL